MLARQIVRHKAVILTFTGNFRLSQRPSLLVSGSGSGKISRSRFSLEKNFELDLWASLRYFLKFHGE